MPINEKEYNGYLFDQLSILECINGHWYVFYHRLTHGTDYSRQACAEEIAVLPDGTIPQAEVTTQGLNGGPLEADGEYEASIACNITNGKMPNIQFQQKKTASGVPCVMHEGEVHFITNIKEGTTVGYKYFDFHGQYLTDILRGEWGFQGLVVTDWGAMNNRVEAFKAGCDLEMPSSNGMFDEEVKKAVEEGVLPEEAIDACVGRIIKMAWKAQETRKNIKDGYTFDAEAHHNLAKKIAAESAVLLKNREEILPLKKETKIALCGAMAETVRYQGAGSSHINPTKLSSLKTAVEALGDNVKYYPSYELNGAKNENELQKAVTGAKDAEAVIIVAGLPDSYESEGYDRAHMAMPESHCELIQEITKVNENIIVVLMGGSPVEMPWLENAKAVLNLYLGGQAVGEAGADLLYGIENPSGKLAETYPVTYKDCSSSETFGVNPRQVEYAESLYVGYRYYEKAGIPVQFPFGYGLSLKKIVIYKK